MAESDRRRSARHSVDYRGAILLSGGRIAPVRIVNLGELGALVTMTELEEAPVEGERVMLVHPRLEGGMATEDEVRTVGAVVRVDLDFEEGRVARNLAVYFDGGAPPEGVEAPRDADEAEGDED